jgi:hypothetical protein
MSPVRETTPHYSENSGYTDSQAPMQSMELVAGQFPSYFPVFDYGLSSEANYSQMNGQIPSGIRRDSPENTMQNTWQEFVAQSGLGMGS